ncbi:MAG: hypothetical protein Kow0059_00830 [Candidatus Sumerlaeia bacterium]
MIVVTDLPDSLEKQPGLLGSVRRPYLPVAGFWARGLAFAADVILLGAVFYVLVFLFKESLFALDLWNTALCAVVVLAYFTLGDGPVGRGRTIGKLLSGVRVTTSEGAPLTLAGAAVRSLIKMELVILQIPLIVLIRRMEQTVEIPIWMIGFFFFYGLGIMMIMAFYGIHLALSPFKQAPYDRLVGALVFKMDDVRTIKQVEDMYDDPRQVYRMNRGALTWAALITLMLFGMLSWLGLRDYSVYINDLLDFRRSFMTTLHFDPVGYPLRFIEIPVPHLKDGAPGQAPHSDGPSAASPSETSTTTSATGAPPQVIIQLQYRAPGGSTPQSLQTLAEPLRNQLRRFRRWVYDQPEFSEELDRIQVMGFQAALIRQIPLIVRPYTELALVVELPPDAADQTPNHTHTRTGEAGGAPPSP